MPTGADWDVDMEDGTRHRVVTDQRDIARWEVQPFFAEDRFTLRARFLVWATLRRQGVYTKPFDVFNETDCVEVRVAGRGGDEEDGEGEQGVDPGQPTTAGTPSSTSRSRRGSRSATS